MAIEFFTLNPSTDIHLVLDPPEQRILQLEVLGFDSSLSAPTVITGQCNYTIVDSTIATVSPLGELEAKKEGRTFLKVVYHDPPIIGTQHEVLARVWVHRQIKTVWFGNNRASVNLGLDNLVLSVYTEFESNDDRGDITGHRYVSFETLTPHVSVDAAGRVTGLIVGDTNVIMRFKNITLNLTVTVKPALTALREIVEPVKLSKISGSIDECRNILFLAEGFTDKKKFDELVEKIAHKITTNSVHSPFPLLKGRINFWRAFEPSGEDGVTIGPPLDVGSEPSPIEMQPKMPGNYTLNQLIDRFGWPDKAESSWARADAEREWSIRDPAFFPGMLEDRVFFAWAGLNGDSPFQARDSAFGLIYGSRPGDRRSEVSPPSTLPSFGRPEHKWYKPVTLPHYLLPDPRRTRSDITKWHNDFFDYLGSLRTVNGPSDKNFEVGRKWQKDGDDQGLVCILIDDDSYGAMSNLHIYSAVSFDAKDRFNTKYNNPVADHRPNNDDALIEATVGTVLHELGHQFFLGDEYEGSKGPPTMADQKRVERFHNLTMHRNVQDQNLQIDPNLVKWNQWFRVEHSSALAKDATYDKTTKRIEVELPASEHGKWRGGEQNVILKTRNINLFADFTLYPAYCRHPVGEIQGLTVQTPIVGDKLVLTGGISVGANKFPKGSVLLIPLFDGVTPMTLILPGVADFMITKNRALHEKKGQCDHPLHEVVAWPPDVGKGPDNIKQVKIAKESRAQLIGLYEGGGTWNCSVFRPAAVCKMRNEYFPKQPTNDRRKRLNFRFCFVCKYVIINEIDPAMLAELDKEYPGESV